MTRTSSMTLTPIPPYDFDLSGSIFSKGDPQVCRYEDGRLRHVIRLNKKLVLSIVQSVGTVDAPGLEVTLESSVTLTQREQEQAAHLLNDTFNLGLDLKPFYRAVKHDPVLKSITGSLKGLRFMKTASVFEALVDAICEQQISLAVARAIETRIIKAFGDTLRIGSDTYYVFPTPQSLAAASIQQLRACGLSQKKAEYVRDTSRMIADGELNPEEFLTYKRIDDIIAELTEIRGIGLWTVEYVLIRGMGRLEAMPADDLGIRRSISLYYFHGDKITPAEARETAVNWGPWRGLASFYLLSATRLGIKA